MTTTWTAEELKALRWTAEQLNAWAWTDDDWPVMGVMTTWTAEELDRMFKEPWPEWSATVPSRWDPAC